MENTKEEIRDSKYYQELLDVANDLLAETDLSQKHRDFLTDIKNTVTQYRDRELKREAENKKLTFCDRCGEMIYKGSDHICITSQLSEQKPPVFDAQFYKDYVLVFMPSEDGGKLKCGKYSITEDGYPDKLIEEIDTKGVVPVGRHYFVNPPHKTLQKMLISQEQKPEPLNVNEADNLITETDEQCKQILSKWLETGLDLGIALPMAMQEYAQQSRQQVRSEAIQECIDQFYGRSVVTPPQAIKLLEKLKK